MNAAIYNVGQQLRKRHPDNPALKLWWENYYHGMWVQTQKGPLIENYLAKLLDVMRNARQDCNRILAIRIDLRFPISMNSSAVGQKNSTLSEFQIFLRRELDRANTKYPHRLRVVWCCEQNTSINPHYHLLLLLNGDAYNSIGFVGKSPCGRYVYENIFHRIVRSWALAINQPHECMEGLVQLPRKPITNEMAVWFFQREDQMTFGQVFGAASYLCKAYSKNLGNGVHCFDGSRG
ncbi:inovirus-type Gp2 protein [Vreelandella venusta]|uniref:YagK/YfjJ domain-containing protein n=1 Tax=Vreelandella venusta TaxID=44935 RepID=UPI00384C2314